MTYIQDQQQVTGNYFGVAFSGVVTESRFVTVKTADGAKLFFVNLDAPISVLGEERDQLCVYAQCDGRPTRYNDCNSEIRAI